MKTQENHQQSPSLSLPSLTPKEKGVLEFLELYMERKGYSPSYTEIKDHFGFASYNSVQRYLKQLDKKGYIHNPGGNQKRAIQVLHSSNSFRPTEHQNLNELEAKPQPKPQSLPSNELFSLPLLGSVAAGCPIERTAHDEYIDIPPALVRSPHKSFALKVSGQSMINDGIHDEDIILVQKQEHANNGEIVVATVNNEATVKHLYLHNNHQNFEGPCVELRPANDDMDSMWFSPEEVEVKGVVVGLIRKF